MNHENYIGKIINHRYELEAKLGAGGYGMVFRARDIETDELVALKLLRPVIANDLRMVTRFRREGTVLFRLRNPHTVLVHEFAYTDDGIFYLAMELLEGHSLKHVVRKEAPISWQRALTILVQVCEALAEAHAAGVVHRDLKPENIFLIERQESADFVKILDFGIAKFLDGEGLGQDYVTQLTGRGRTVGTVRYMSPEQILGRSLDGRSDIYTLGVVLYRLLTSRMPFPGAHKAGALIAAQLASPPKEPSKVREGLDITPALDRLVLRMLEKEPHNRFKDVEALRATCIAMLRDGTWGEAVDVTAEYVAPRKPVRAEAARPSQAPRGSQVPRPPQVPGGLELPRPPQVPVQAARRSRRRRQVRDTIPVTDMAERVHKEYSQGMISETAESPLQSEDIVLITESTVDETGVTEAEKPSGKRRTQKRPDTVDEEGLTAESEVVLLTSRKKR